jgi:phage terminase large subunit-like protein
MGKSVAEQVAELTPEQQEEIYAQYTEEELALLNYDAEFWLRPEQLIPEGNWRVTALIAGRGFGKTLAMTQWVRKMAIKYPGCRIGIAAKTVMDIRNTVVTGESGILAVHPEHERPEYKPSTTSLHWPNGSYAQLLSSESPDAARGPQFHFAVGDEFAAWNTTADASGATLYSNLLMATRLQLPGGGGGQVLLATTPKRTKVMRELIERSKNPEEKIVIVRGNTFENSSLSKDYLDFMVRQYGNSDLAKQELMGEMIDDAEGIVFTTDMIESAKSLVVPSTWPLRIIAVDPSVSGDPKQRDECGIMAIGSTVERDLTKRRAAVLADYSLNASPDVWARQVADAARAHRTKFVVVEKNQGGQLLQMAINAEDPSLKVMFVHAKQGKVTRSEPVVIAMQQGRVALADTFPELEDQLLFYDPMDTSTSPDRMDAMVWGIISVLISPPEGLHPGGFRATSPVGRRLPSPGVGMGSYRQHFRAQRSTLRGR